VIVEVGAGGIQLDRIEAVRGDRGQVLGREAFGVKEVRGDGEAGSQIPNCTLAAGPAPNPAVNP
jgi:hypothetical protein